MLLLCIVLVLLSDICQVPAANTTSGITQDSGLIVAEDGQNVTLKCFSTNNAVTFFSWYQQSLGGKPLIISSWMKHHKEASIYPAYKDRFRILPESKDGTHHLMITDLHPSDSATYYCGTLEFNTIEFGQGAFLHVRPPTSNIRAAVHQPALKPLQSGDSVNLSCTVYAEKCVGEQTLYWFRHGAAQPAVMYLGAGQCKHLQDEKAHMTKCTLNLAIKSVSSATAGMYYCALASCGEIVFGNGTRVVIADSTKAPPFLLHYLSVALAVSIILLIVFAFIMYKLKQTSCSVCNGTVSHPTCSAASDATNEDADLHYAALGLNRTSERLNQQESVRSVCVYSSVKTRKR
ncbi:uncharacterized protein [Pempheris klunzingeri]|uniref:uncharacterized protein isoform X2 n=1 Tax=Pempheris klunzingeri TaxID=3127111 RepID=UPI00397F1D4F